MLAGCATQPAPIERVASDREALFATVPGAPETWAASGVAGSAPAEDWLSQFNDPVMQDLVREALANSPNLAARAAVKRNAEAFTRVARSERLPAISASVSAGGTSAGAELPGGIERFNDPAYGLGLDASWEAGLWNRIGANIAEADADFAASEADFAAAELALSAQTARSWIFLNEALAQERVAGLTLEARARVLRLTERRFESGLADALDVRTSRSALAGAEAAIAARQQLSKESARRLEILLGRYPAAEIEAPANVPALGSMPVEGNPALLLSRRPDIAALEARVVAAGLRVEQARAAMLPSLRLTAGLSANDTDLADLIDPQLIAARLIASVAQPLFTGGRLDAQRDAAIAQTELAVANYASGALTAWREVEDALTADGFLAVQEEAQARALEEALLAEEIAERRYVSGTVSIFNLIDAQTRRLTAESQLVSARASRAANRIDYHLALGGGLPAGVAKTDTPAQPGLNAVLRGRS